MSSDLSVYITILLSLISFIYALISLIKNIQYKKEKQRFAYSIKIIQEATCYNISEFSQLAHMADCRHRQIQNYLSSSKINIKKLRDHVHSFVHFFNNSLESIFSKNIRFIELFFLDRDPIPPSIRLRFLSDDKILTLYANDKDKSIQRESKLNEDTEIYFVIQQGNYYLSNNINSSIRQRKYKNVRRHLTAKYNSTMVIPISLMTNFLSPEFVELFNLDVSDNVPRLNYGFLCIEHQNKNYFYPELDIHIGYIFSEYFLLYLILKNKYFEQSLILQKAKKIIEQGAAPDRYSAGAP